MAIVPTVRLAIKGGKKLKDILKILKDKRKNKKLSDRVNTYKKTKIKNLGYDDTKKIIKNDHNAAASGEQRVGIPSRARSIRNIDPLTEYKVTRSGQGSPISDASDWREDMERSFGGLDTSFFNTKKKNLGGEIKGNGIAIRVKKFTGVK